MKFPEDFYEYLKNNTLIEIKGGPPARGHCVWSPLSILNETQNGLSRKSVQAQTPRFSTALAMRSEASKLILSIPRLSTSKTAPGSARSPSLNPQAGLHLPSLKGSQSLRRMQTHQRHRADRQMALVPKTSTPISPRSAKPSTRSIANYTIGGHLSVQDQVR